MFLAVLRQFLFLTCLLSLTLYSYAEYRDKPFNIGKVTNNPAKQYQHLAPMSDYLADKLGYREGHTIFTKNIDDMVGLFHESKVDLFSGSAWEAAVIMHSGLGQPFAVKHKEGQAGYRSLIVVRANSDIHDIKDLKGKLIAFEDPDSTSAYRIPAMMIQQQGLIMVENLERPSDSEVLHYRFSGAEQNSSALLFREIVDAIALSDRDWKMADNVPEFQKELFKVIYESPVMPRAVEVVRQNLPSTIREKLGHLFIGDGALKEAPDVMLSYHETTGFSEIDTETIKVLTDLIEYYKE